MDPVNILDHYRLPLINSSDAIQVLAYLLRDGPQTLDFLSKNLKSSQQETYRQLATLYRASLVKKFGIDTWDISAIGEHILSYLGLDELATVDLTETLALNESERVFFNSWLRSSAKELKSKTCRSLLRTYCQTEESKISWWDESVKSQSSIKHAIMIASDSLLHYAGIDDAWLALRRRQDDILPKDRSSQLSAYMADSIKNSPFEEEIKLAWKEGMKHYLNSNRILLFIPYELLEPVDQNTLHFTLLRTIDAVMSGSADEGLRVSCIQWQVHDCKSYWNSMLKIRNLEQQARDLCYKKGWLEQPSVTEDFVASLAEKTMGTIDNWINADQSQLFNKLIGNDQFQELVDQLNQATARIKNEGDGVVPKDVHTPLLTALDHLSSMLRKSYDDSLAS
jgi:hypothetical protein